MNVYFVEQFYPENASVGVRAWAAYLHVMFLDVTKAFEWIETNLSDVEPQHLRVRRAKVREEPVMREERDYIVKSIEDGIAPEYV